MVQEIQISENKKVLVENTGDSQSFCWEYLHRNSEATCTITSKNPLLVQSRKWHAHVQSPEKIPKPSVSVISWKCQGKPNIWEVRIAGLVLASREKRLQDISVCSPPHPPIHFLSGCGNCDDSTETWQSARVFLSESEVLMKDYARYF